jgi:cell division protein FtsN
MHLADHIRPLLRDHDCVIIPDFGGLVAEVSPARALPGRQALSPPTKLVAFNQALTRNDGLLVDALSQHLGLPIAQAREAVRTAVASLQRELDDTNRTELPGIGIFRRAAGRGLAFEYTGADNLLASAFGLPELVARPVRATEPRAKRPQPALRGTATRRTRLARALPGGIIAVAVGLFLMVNYQVALTAGYLPTRWQAKLPQLEWNARPATPTGAEAEPQQATLAQHDFTESPVASEGITPLPSSTTSAESKAAVQAESPEISGPETSTAALETAPAPPRRAAVAAVPVETKVPVAGASARAGAKALVPAKAPAPAVSSTTIKYRTGRYYVIAGAYSSLAGAERGRKVLAKTGHQSHIILPPFGSRLFRLTAADFPDLASAQREAQRLRVSTHCDYNTLKF